MIKEAIYSDGTGYFCVPDNPAPYSKVKLRLRMEKVDKCVPTLCCGDKVYPMAPVLTKGEFTYYEAELSLEEEPIDYIFKIPDGDEYFYYDRLGDSLEKRDFAAFRIVPGFSVPQWSKGAVMYQILVDRFCNGDSANNVKTGEYFYIDRQVSFIEDWDEPPKAYDVNNFYGGDLQGVESKLDYLKNLGVEAIYFNPIFVSPSNHKYDSQDYDYIDPHIACIPVDGGEVLAPGDNCNERATAYKCRTTQIENLEASNEYFAHFVTKAHEKGLKVIIDGVFNHCGSFHKWIDVEKIYGDNSQLRPDYFAYNENGEYEGWWNHKTLPKLNYEGSKALEEYILEIAAKWLLPPYNADGWRLDVAADLGHSADYNHHFWKRFRQAVKSAKPEAIILAEHYGDARSWLGGDQWDTIMNYDAFMEPVSYFLTGMEKHSDGFEPLLLGNGENFEHTMKYSQLQFMSQSIHCSMNQLSNHDHSRFLTRTNGKVGRVGELGSDSAAEGINVGIFRLGVLMQMTWPGAPTIYYGDEAGQVGYTDPDNRRTYPWGKEDKFLIDFHRDAISLHKYSPALRSGSLIFLCRGEGFVGYGRFNENERVLVFVNASGEERELKVPVMKAEVPRYCSITQIFTVFKEGYSLANIQHSVVNGMLNLKLNGYSGMVLRHKDEEDRYETER